jgi:hypothetical protein
VRLSLYIGLTRAAAAQRGRPKPPRPLPVVTLALAGLAALTLARFAAAAEAVPAPAPPAAPITVPVVESAPVPPDSAPGAAAAPADAPALVRVSSSFEAKHAAAVLRQVGKLFGAGFVRRDAERVAAEIDALPAEQSRIWEFSAVQKGKAYALRVRARLDEFGDVDLDFFSAPEISSAVRSAVDRYLNARGL